MPRWNIDDTLEFIGCVVNIERPNGNLKSILIKNILLDQRGHEIKEILYVENKGTGKKCLIKPGRDFIIKPTGEDPIIKPVSDHRTLEELAEDSGSHG